MDIIKYLKEAIKVEFHVSDLYLLFANQFEEDYKFWWKIANEELNHAALLKTGIEFAKLNEFPDEIILGDINDLINLNKKFIKFTKKVKKNPSRQLCFEIALEIENSAGESHYQETMSNHSDNKIIKIFQHLNHDDIDHYNRIKDYYSKNII